MNETQKEKLKEYKKENIKRVPLDVSYEFYTRLLKHSALDGRSVNGYIKRSLETIMNMEDELEKERNDKNTRLREKLKELNR